MILLYDAECSFCRWAVVRVLARDRQGRIEPLAIQSERGQQLLADLPPERRLESLHTVADNGLRLSAGPALRALLGVLPDRRLARMASLSPAATDAAYRFVARHRRTFSRLLGSRIKRRADRQLKIRETREDFGADGRL